MPKLLKLGIAEKIIAKPTKYRATPIQACIEILFKQKNEECIQLKKATENFLKHYKSKANLCLDEPSQFIVASEKEIIYKKYRQEIENAQKSIEAIGPAQATEGALSENYATFQRKIKQGIKIRIITEKLQKKAETEKSIEQLQKNPLFEIRELPTKPPVQLAIQDRKRVDIVIPEPSNRLVDLWTNHISIVTLAVTYFEEMWNKAQPIT